MNRPRLVVLYFRLHHYTWFVGQLLLRHINKKPHTRRATEPWSGSADRMVRLKPKLADGDQDVCDG